MDHNDIDHSHLYVPPPSGSSKQPDRSQLIPSRSPRLPEDDEEGAAEESIFRNMTFEEVLEDLNARFLINLPKEEMTLVRIYWQAEQA